MIGATDARSRIGHGELSAVDLLEGCLRRIDALEPELQAWVHVDREGARLTSRQAYEAAKHGATGGLLFGIPVGIKDIFDVGGMPTRAGAGAFAHYTAETDSAAVRRLRAEGAIILGKTATTEFAYADPAPTRNPWNLEHTPGGSSSGSAAAVAAGMVPLAIGSQTVGSTLRPAAYCGIVGLKPTHGRISAAGCIPLAWSLDHVGIFSRSVADAALMLRVLAGHDPADPFSLDGPVPRYDAAPARQPPVLGLPRAFYQDHASHAVVAHLEAVAGRLAAAGARIEPIDMPMTRQEILAAANPVLRVEAASYHAETFARHADEYRPVTRSLIEAGLATSAIDYVRAQQARRRLQQGMRSLLDSLDAILMPVAPTTAPAGLHSTGDASFCAPASSAGLPAVSLPSGLDGDGLPLAVQLICGHLQEEKLLSIAAWVEERLQFQASPRLAMK